MSTKRISMLLALAAMFFITGCLPASRMAFNSDTKKIAADRVVISDGQALTDKEMTSGAASTGSAINVDSPVNESADSTNSKEKGPVRSLWDDIWTIPGVVIEETPEMALKPGNSFLLLAAGGASIAMHNSGADAQVARNFENRGNLNHDVDKITDYMGGPGQHFAAAGLWYLLSANAGDQLNKDRSWTMIKALSVTGATTLGLKIIRGNNCPNGKSLAWPSGHTSSSFTVAAVLDEFYGPEVGIPAYIGASFVGYRMMDSGDHWASDVLFGGVLGYLVGHHVAGKDEAMRIAGFDIAPLTMLENGEPATGLMLIKKF